MVFGISLATYTLIHVVISLIGIVTGLIVLYGMLTGKRMDSWARYTYHLRGGWRRTYIITAVIALYLNVFVLVVQAFRRVASLNALAPKQNEPPFAIAQGIVFLLFLVLGILATMKFPPQDAVLSKSVELVKNAQLKIYKGAPHGMLQLTKISKY